MEPANKNVDAPERSSSSGADLIETDVPNVVEALTERSLLGFLNKCRVAYGHGTTNTGNETLDGHKRGRTK